MFKGLKKLGKYLFWAAIVVIALDGSGAAIVLHGMLVNFFHLATTVLFGNSSIPVPTITTK